MRYLQTALYSLAVVFLTAGTAQAAAGETNWTDLAWRTVTAAVVFLIIYKAAGKKIADALTGRREGIAQELQDLENRKEKARTDLAEVEKRIANLDRDRAAILHEYETRGETLKAEIIARAEAEAAQILNQARQTVQGEVEAAITTVREELAAKIVAAASESIAGSLTDKDQEKLLDSVLGKVVLQ